MQIIDIQVNTHLDSSKRRASDPNGSGPRVSACCGNILLLGSFFLFSSSKASEVNILTIANFSYFLENRKMDVAV